MNHRPSDSGERDFLAVACECNMLSADQAAALWQQSTASGVDPARLALRAGLMSAVQIDIVETLQRPFEAAPGYEILGVIGHGGMGVVYRARQCNLDRPVALKTVLLSQMNDPSFAARFEQEARAVGRLRHPHIVAAYDYGNHQGRLFLAMELFEGEDADSRVRRLGPFSQRAAWGIARQAAAGLAHAAHAGVVHRDVKPANLLLAPPPEGYLLPAGAPMVKVADFGLAFLGEHDDSRTRLTSARTVIGSPHYMSPEQLNGEAVDWRADVYSLGATIWHLIAGEPPFNASGVSQIVVLKLADERPSLRKIRPQVAPESDSLIAQMLSRRPQDRCQSYVDLVAQIDAVLALPSLSDEDTQVDEFADTGAIAQVETAILPRGESTLTPEGRKQGRPKLAPSKRLAYGLVAAVIILAGIAASLWLWPRGLPTDRVLVASNRSANLFDGMGTGGWRTISGLWRDEPTDDGVVLSGENGIAQRAVAIPGEPPITPANYRVTLVARRHQAKAIELQFGFAVASDGGRRAGDSHVLRIDDVGSTIGYCADVQSDFERRAATRPLTSSDAEASHVIHLERQRDNWWVFVDERLAGIAPGIAHEAPFIRLAAEGGKARFSDIAVEELVEPTKTR